MDKPLTAEERAQRVAAKQKALARRMKKQGLGIFNKDKPLSLYAETDLKKTFERVRSERNPQAAEPVENVTQINKAKRG